MIIRIKVKKPKQTRFERSEEGQALAEGYTLWHRIAQVLGKSDLNTVKRQHGKDFQTKQYATTRVYYLIDDITKFFNIPGLGEELRVPQRKKRIWTSHLKIPGRK